MRDLSKTHLLGSGVLDVVLDGRKADFAWQRGEAHLGLLGQQQREVLHHALEPSLPVPPTYVSLASCPCRPHTSVFHHALQPSLGFKV